MNTYRTVDLARMFGIHVNTVRLYERYGLIPKAERTQSGYRIFTELHVEQFKLARAALRVEVLQNGLTQRNLIFRLSKLFQAVRTYKKRLIQMYTRVIW